MNLTSVKEIIPLMERHGFNFSKSLGQNFLINAAIPEKIAESSVSADSGMRGSVTKTHSIDIPVADRKNCIIEVGPGVGCLTKELAARAKKVVAVEIDKKLLPVLSETLADCGNVEIVNADIMELDINALIEEKGLENVSVCANLPYYITTPVIMKLLESGLPLKSITVMIQKEVAQRFLAKPGSKDYGAITPVLNYYTKLSYLFDVGAGNFMPRPNVDSAVIKMELVPPPVAVEDEKTFFRVIRAAFAMRRKTLANNIQKEFSLPKEKIGVLLEKAGLEPAVRGERLSLEEFAKLGNMILDFI